MIGTDDLREVYPGSKIHFNCKDGDEAFTDDYVLWLENRLITILNNDQARIAEGRRVLKLLKERKEQEEKLHKDSYDFTKAEYTTTYVKTLYTNTNK